MAAQISQVPDPQARSYREIELDASSAILREFLLHESPQFRTCDKYKKLVANNPKADEIYLKTKQVAEKATLEERKRFQEMMIQIADQMQAKHGIYTVEGVAKENMRIFDICMAPGGFTEAILRHTGYKAKAFGITLDPVSQGGLPIVIDEKLITGGLLKCDVTHLYGECTNQMIPIQHRGVEKCEVPPDWKNFHLIFCDGKPEKFTTEAWTEQSDIERRRLKLSQLILAMQRIADHGTIVMLLHSIDHFNSANLLHTFSKFATVNAFKPPRAHKKRSSFYMIAQNIRPHTWAAQTALQTWRDAWYMVSFGGANGTGELPKPNESMVRCLEEEFGQRLVEMGQDLWELQARALMSNLPETYEPGPDDFVAQQPRGFSNHDSSIPRGTKLSSFPASSTSSPHHTPRRSDAKDWNANKQKPENVTPLRRNSTERGSSGTGPFGGATFGGGAFGKSLQPGRAPQSVRSPLGTNSEARGFNPAAPGPPPADHLVRSPLSPEVETKGVNAPSWRIVKDKK